jgi:hypothetical protein
MSSSRLDLLSIMNKPRRRFRRIARRMLALGGVLLLIAAWPGCTTLTVGPETTHVTGPIDFDGHVDYAEALNARLSEGVTPENNAAVFLWRASGPTSSGQRFSDKSDQYQAWFAEYSERLGLPPVTADEHFVSWFMHARKNADPNDSDPLREVDRLDRTEKVPWTTKEQPEIAAWLKHVEKSLSLVVEASRRPAYFNPLLPRRERGWSAGITDVRLNHFDPWRPLYRALLSRAMLSAGEGRFDDAWSDLLACHWLARLVAHGGHLNEVFFGFAIDRETVAANVALLSVAEVSSARLLSCLRDLQQLPPLPSIADQMDRYERLIFLDVMLQTATQGPAYLGDIAEYKEWKPPNRYRFFSRLFTRSVNWDPAFRKANQWFDRISGTLRVSERPRREQELAAIDEELRSLRDTVKSTKAVDSVLAGPSSRGDVIGDVLVSRLLPAFWKSQWSAERTEQMQNNVRIAFALAAYRADHRRYPTTLDDLAPKYLAKIPADLFSGGPLIYRLTADGYFLNSVGPNGRDDDGHLLNDDPPGDDVALRMPPPPKP